MSNAFKCDRCKQFCEGTPWQLKGSVLSHRETLDAIQDICDACKESFHAWLKPTPENKP